MPPPKPTIRFHQGRILVDGWPADVPAPPGTHASAHGLTCPARLRARVRQALAHAAVPYIDRIGTYRTNGRQPDITSSPTQSQTPRLHPHTPTAPAGILQALRTSQHRGILIGQNEATHYAIARQLAPLTTTPVLIIVPDSATAHRWQTRFATKTDADATNPAILSIHRAVRDMHWLGGHHDALIIDSPEHMPATLLDQTLDECAALARIGLAAMTQPRNAERWCTRIGPVLAVRSHNETPRRELLLVPMPPDIDQRYQDAWSTFLAAFDRFVAMRGDAGFGTFLAQARSDPSQRPAVHAWHEAIRCAAWHDNKSLVLDDLLHRHSDSRMLLFTPDRESAYQLSQRHLIPALTAELPQRERAALLDAFASGTLNALAGPKLLDSGVAERSADVGVLLGGGFGPAQRASRCRRVRDDGVIFELASQDTLEVGRAHRWHQATADTTVVVHKR